MATLFATTVSKAKPRESGYKLFDGGGLYLLVRPNGAKLWRLNYRYLGKHRTMTFGAWPDVSLADACGRREEARRLLDKAYPRIGNRPVAKITAQEILVTLRAVEATGRYESARRMRSVLSRVFRYAVATTRAERDPASDLRGALTGPPISEQHSFRAPGKSSHSRQEQPRLLGVPLDEASKKTA